VIEIYIADDHPMVIRGVEAMLETETDIEITNVFTTGNELMQVLGVNQPNVLLLDINLPDANGIELCAQISSRYPQVGIIGLSNYSETAFIKNMIRSGAKSYLLKNTEKQELIKAIKAVHEGEQYIPEKLKELLLNESFGTASPTTFFVKLSTREQQVLELIARELTTQEIADKLFISAKTVESHRKSLLQKLNTKNVAGLIRSALNRGLIT
jgi:DNA-binding NarL/FixJ family response regulator